MRVIVWLASLALLLFTAPETLVGDEEWGSLGGRIVYDGDPPKPRAFKVDKDVECCGAQSDESLLVDAETLGVRNVVVCLVVQKDEPAPPIHPDLIEAAKRDVTIDIENCRFRPCVAAVAMGQKLAIRNTDPVGHNAKIQSISNPAVAPLIGEPIVERRFKLEEKLPVQVDCSIHPWMSCWRIVKNHPYVAITDDSGKFEIEQLPAGKWTFQFWHERAGYLENVEQKGEAARWNHGRLNVVITAGETVDLGEIKVAA